jgi:hypothetical protein
VFVAYLITMNAKYVLNVIALWRKLLPRRIEAILATTISGFSTQCRNRVSEDK